ncbi:hypothetical protein GIB67_006371 [Kingdonia uniflora]|uniref:Zinc-ribbon domain-containing protein n=1 Tax=Kingdonia uniflora TaxID=39325 RepID=A0A7J7P0N4_9MAGN|nr:hypothetical protein GIB67_006371 [Kingdonia uniflora]
MEEGAKVRVVRCPKCENLLPELPNLPVYQCGGCGAILQAKKQTQSNDGSSVKSEEERVRVVSDKGGVLNLSDNVSEMSDRETDGIIERKQRLYERVLPERVMNSSSRSAERDILTENNPVPSFGGRSLEQDTGYNGASVKSEEESVEMVSGKVGTLNLSDNALEMSDRETDGVIARGQGKYERVIPDRTVNSGQNVGYNGLSVKSEEERVRVISSKGGALNFHDNASEISDRETDGVIERRERKYERVVLDRLVNSGRNTSSRTAMREVLTENKPASRYDQKSSKQDIGYNGKYRRRTDNWVGENNQELNMNRGKFVGDNFGKEITQNEEAKLQYESSSGSRMSGQVEDWRTREREGVNPYRKTPRAVAEGVRFSAPPFSDERPSYYHPGSSYGYGSGSRKSRMDPNLGGPDRVEYLEQDRAELLRKLEELKDQISKSCDVSDRPKERVPVPLEERPCDTYVGRDTWFPEVSSRANRPSIQPFMTDNSIHRHPYYTNSHEPVPLMNRHDMDMQNFYPPPNEIPGYGDHFGHQMPARVPNQPYRQYMDIDPGHNPSFPHNTFFHQPACSCFQCYNKHQQLPSQVPPSVVRNRRFTDPPTNSMFSHLEHQRGYNPREREAISPPLRSREPEIVGVGHSRPQRTTLVNKTVRRCRPIAGGAPFITCSSCFELLPLPKKLVLMEKTQKKLKCGACSTIIPFFFESKKLVFSSPTQINDVASNSYPSSAETVKENILHSPDHANRGITYSDDYDNSGYNFQSTDTEPVLSSTDQRLNLSNSDKMHGVLSSSSSVSEDCESHENVIAQIEVLNSVESPPKAISTAAVPRSPIHENSDHLVNKFGKGNRSKRINQEEVILVKATSRHVKDASMATEINVSFDEYSNTGTSLDSREVTREEDRPKNNKGSDSFFMGLIKGFRDHSKSSETTESEISNVSVNGLPIPERLVKKAEKLAGKIHPGHYWYDSRAGFWGVIGHPCLGIIPPFIQEFNHPISRNCAGGNTGVVVNGRELHQKDLNLLTNRGLPTAKDRFYILEICGRVLDERSGEELDSLGKLAPT